MASDWSAVGWRKFPEDAPDDQVKAWRKEKIPFVSNANALQTVDVWEPRAGGPYQNAVPPPEYEPSRKGPWIIYIHGGAWRDPMVTASSFSATANQLLADPAAYESIGGLASLNYSLSPHPNHPTNPAPPKDPSQRQDPSRAAKHPDHIVDILAGIAFLQRHAGFGENYILVGHSCGAAMAYQVAMDRSRWTNDSALHSVKKPKVVLGLNGIYDIPELVSNAGSKHEHLQELYQTFTRGAFGDSKEDWKAISPRYVDDWAGEWGDGVRATLTQSLEDSLLPYRQTEGMLASLKRSAGPKLKVDEVEISGDHNYIWERGDRLSEILLAIVKEEW